LPIEKEKDMQKAVGKITDIKVFKDGNFLTFSQKKRRASGTIT